MGKLIPGLLWCGVAFGLLAGWAGQSNPGVVVISLLVAGSCVVGLVIRRRIESETTRSLPPQLDRLWYKAGADGVTFRWTYRAKESRVRILCSTSVSALRSDDGSLPNGTRRLVYEGSAEDAVDGEVVADTTYHYTVWAQHDGGPWMGPARIQVSTMDPGLLRHIEASPGASRPSLPGPSGLEPRSTLGKTLVPDPRYDPHGTDVAWARALGSAGPAAIVGKMAGDVVADGALAVVDALLPDKLAAEGWVEVT